MKDIRHRLHSSLSLDDLYNVYHDLLLSNALCDNHENNNLLVIEELLHNAICLMELGEDADARHQVQMACFILSMKS